jgi:hypothetical protein
VRSIFKCGQLELRARVFPDEGGEPRHGMVSGDGGKAEELAQALMDSLE